MEIKEMVYLNVTADDIPSDYSPRMQACGIKLWCCDSCYYHNYQADDKCDRCGEPRYKED